VRATRTAEGALAFILDLVERVETTMCQVALVRIDAGFPDEKRLVGLEANGTPYLARIKNNKVLDRMAAAHLRRPPGRPPAEPRVWFHEMSYAAGAWSRPRRVVLVVLEQPDDLLLRHFWLLTSISANTLDGEALLGRYRQRGTAEGHMGELMDVLAPALSSASRARHHGRIRLQRGPAAIAPAGLGGHAHWTVRDGEGHPHRLEPAALA
jgi:hypothetical protein